MINVASRLDTGTEYLQGLIQDIKQGEIKVPKFQRRFVWSNKQALDLLDSIAHNYPIGSILLWKTTNKLAAERNIGDFKLPDTDDLTPTNYVLDGQQRLTVIYSCLGAPAPEPGFAAGYDLAKEEFVELPPTHQIHIFPLRLLFATSQLLDFRTAFKAHPKGDTFQERLDTLIQVLTGYKIPVVTLKELTVEEVCPIFERINSSGTRLSTYDLMVAATWSQEFDLNDEVAEIAGALDSKRFNDIDGDTILKCVSAINCDSVLRDDILGLRRLGSTKKEELISQVEESVLKTVDLLTTEFGIYCWDFVPYEAIVVVLCYIFSKAGQLDADQTKRVRQWFWRASLGERYRGASDSFISKDLRTVRDYVLDGKGSANSFGEIPSLSALIGSEFRSNNSRSRAFVLALAAKKPRNLTNGLAIDMTDALSIYNRKQFHHIYPKAYLRRQQLSDNENSVVNICMLAASENNDIGDRDPNTYIPDLVRQLGQEADPIFSSNLLPTPQEVDYSRLSYADFLQKRASLLSNLVNLLCEGGSV